MMNFIENNWFALVIFCYMAEKIIRLNINYKRVLEKFHQMERKCNDMEIRFCGIELQNLNIDSRINVLKIDKSTFYRQIARHIEKMQAMAQGFASKSDIEQWSNEILSELYKNGDNK